MKKQSSGGPQAFLERIGSSEKSDKTHQKQHKHRKHKDSKRNERLEKKYIPKRRAKNDKKEPHSKTLILSGEVQKNSRGFAFLLQEPKDFFIPQEFAGPLLSGDHVKIWIHSHTGEILKLEITKRALQSFIGTYVKHDKYHIVELRDKTMLEHVTVAAPHPRDPVTASVLPGHRVMVTLEQYEPFLKGRIIQDFGPKLAPKYDTLAVITKSQWPQEFSAAAQAQATEASLNIIQSAANALGRSGARRDLRSKPLVTIDGADARDFDDAVLVEKTKSGYVLYVAIADVAEFVPFSSPLDREAYGRSTSVYFPDYVLPMLPEALSNEACSLKPNVDRLTLVCEMHYDYNGKKKSSKFYEALINSKRRCIYEDVDREAKEGDPFWVPHFALYELIRMSREKRGSLDFQLPETKVVLDQNGETIDICKAERLDAHRLIEEFMIAANESVTEIMERERWPFIYRIHEPPQGEALERFTRFALALGLKPNFDDGQDPRLVARFIDSISEHPLAPILNYLILRSLKQARYEPINLKHFGLASKAYTHFTSPIRRYPDLMVHRILKRHTHHEDFNEDETTEYNQYLVEACTHCSRQERKAQELERDVIKVKKARFIEKHLGETFSGRIISITASGLFVELEKWFVEGLVSVDELGGDLFEFNEQKMMMYGKRTGRKFKLGDQIRVVVLRCDIDQGLVDFTLESAILEKQALQKESS